MPAHRRDNLQTAHAAHHVGKVFATSHFDREQHRRRHAIAFLVLDVLDVRTRLRDRRSNLGEHAWFVGDLNACSTL